MSIAADRIPGITVDVEELVRVQAQLSGLSLNNLRRRVSSHPGAKQTRFRSRGMEYEESRAYVAGDDVRTMDWRVMARMGEAHTKIFAEEKQRSSVLAIDLSASMYFGTQYAFKSCAAAYTAATAGWLATLVGNRLGGLIVSPQSHQEIRPGKNRSGLMGVFHHLSGQTRLRLSGSEMTGGQSASRLNFLLDELQRVIKPGSNIALISDFLGINDQTASLLSRIVRHNDVTAYWIHDQTEVEHWPVGHYQLLVDDENMGVDVPTDVEKSWLNNRQHEYRSNIENLTSAFNIPVISLSCNQEITSQIVHQLSE